MLLELLKSWGSLVPSPAWPRMFLDSYSMTGMKGWGRGHFTDRKISGDSTTKSLCLLFSYLYHCRGHRGRDCEVDMGLYA